jgi:uncharacterized protein (TIGR02246 family)
MTFRPCLAFAFLVAISGAGGARAGDDPSAVAEATMHEYISAWDRADARTLGAQFAADGDFINPTGYYARGPAAVEAFYRSAFARGYAGSHGGFEVKAVRALTADVMAVDGVWSIEGAPGADGKGRATERGLAAAVLVRKAGTWRIVLLREQSSAAALDIPPAGTAAEPARRTGRRP